MHMSWVKRTYMRNANDWSIRKVLCSRVDFLVLTEGYRQVSVGGYICAALSTVIDWLPGRVYFANQF